MYLIECNLNFCSLLKYKTRKSSCVNASGIPPTAYRVLHLLSYPGGYPIPGWGYPHHGVPHPDLVRGCSIPDWGVPPLWGILCPDLAGWYPHHGVSPGQEGTWDQLLGYSWKGHGTSESIMGQRWGSPLKGHGTRGSIMGWRWGTPPV